MHNDAEDSEDYERYDAQQEPPAKVWIELDEQERTMLIDHHHQRLGRRHVKMPNPALHASMHAVIENQLAENNPPATRAALVRLMNEGLDRHEALHAVASIVSAHMFEMMKSQKDFDEATYCRELDALSAESWRASAEEED